MAYFCIVKLYIVFLNSILCFLIPIYFCRTDT